MASVYCESCGEEIDLGSVAPKAVLVWLVDSMILCNSHIHLLRSVIMRQEARYSPLTGKKEAYN